MMYLKGTAALALLLLGIGLPAFASSAGVRYTIADLGTLGGASYSSAYGINDSGRVVGEYDTPGMHAFVYDGTMHGLDAPGWGWTRAWSINASGKVVGWGYDSAAGWVRAFLYDGTTHDLGTLGTDSYAYGIDDSDRVVGWFNALGAPHAFLYDGKMHDLGTMGGIGAWPYDISNRGRIVGQYRTESGHVTNDRAFLYDGTVHDLGTLAGDSSLAHAINESDHVAGGVYSFSGTGYSRAFLYDGTMRGLGTLGGGNSWAYGINDSDQVVGYAQTGTGAWHAFLYDGVSMRDLNDLIDPGSGWTLFQARAINNVGQIAGTGSNSSGQEQAFLLTPVPEPSGLFALICGLGGLLALARHRG